MLLNKRKTSILICKSKFSYYSVIGIAPFYDFDKNQIKFSRLRQLIVISSLFFYSLIIYFGIKNRIPTFSNKIEDKFAQFTAEMIIALSSYFFITNSLISTILSKSSWQELLSNIVELELRIIPFAPKCSTIKTLRSFASPLLLHAAVVGFTALWSDYKFDMWFLVYRHLSMLYSGHIMLLFIDLVKCQQLMFSFLTTELLQAHEIHSQQTAKEIRKFRKITFHTQKISVVVEELFRTVLFFTYVYSWMCAVHLTSNIYRQVITRSHFAPTPHHAAGLLIQVVFLVSVLICKIIPS